MSPENVESMSRVAFRLERDLRLIQAAQDSFFCKEGLTREEAKALPESTRATLNARWNVSSEKARLDIALARADDLPCAEWPLTSFRYRSSLGAIMIGAATVEEALSEANRSLCEGEAVVSNLDVWDWPSCAYRPVSQLL